VLPFEVPLFSLGPLVITLPELFLYLLCACQQWRVMSDADMVHVSTAPVGVYAHVNTFVVVAPP
jgi:hypothetical protein